MSNLFASRRLRESLAACVYPGRRTELARVVVAGQLSDPDGLRFDVLLVDGKPATQVPFIDFLLPRTTDEAPHPSGPVLHVRYLAAVGLPEITAQGWEDAPPPGCRAAPFVRLRDFPDFAAYVRAIRARSSQPFSRKDDRRGRKLQRGLGPLRCVFHTQDHALLATCMDWKSEQYRRTGFVDLFASTGYRRWFHAMMDLELLRLSVLFAGDRPVAIGIGCYRHNKYYDWIPAYDRRFVAHAPGKLLREGLLAECHRRGIDEYDFLIGDEDFKYLYATHVRPVTPLGRLGLAQRVWRPVRGAVRASLIDNAAIYRHAQGAMRLVRQAVVDRT